MLHPDPAILLSLLFLLILFVPHGILVKRKLSSVMGCYGDIDSSYESQPLVNSHNYILKIIIFLEVNQNQL